MSAANPRRIETSRKTKETDIAVVLDLSGPGDIHVDTGLPFFDHLLTSMAFHGGFGLSVTARGDVEEPHFGSPISSRKRSSAFRTRRSF